MTGPRIGPNTAGQLTIWTRHIAGRTWLFIATPEGVTTRPTSGPDAYQPTHHFTKEN